MSSGPPPGPGAAASSALQPSWLAVSSVLPDRLQPLPRRRRGCEPRPQRRRWRAACGRQVSRRPGPRPVPWESCLTLAPRTRRGAGSAWNVPVLTAEGRAGRGAGVWQTQPDISGQKQGEISVLGACPQGPGQTLLLQREGFWRTGPASPAGGEAPRGPGARRLSCPFLVSRALLDTTPGCPGFQIAFLSLWTMPPGDAGLAQEGGALLPQGPGRPLTGPALELVPEARRPAEALRDREGA